MKTFALLICCIVYVLSGCNKNSSSEDDPLNKSIDSGTAKNDLAVLKQIIFEAHPSFDLYIAKKDIDRLIDSIGASFPKNVSLRDFYNGLSYLINKMGCSHTDANLPVHMYDTLDNRKFFFPYPVLWVENKLLINTKEYAFPVGTEIISINGRPSGQVLRDLAYYNPVEGSSRPAQLTMASKRFAFLYYLKWGRTDKFELRVIDSTGKRKYTSELPISFEDWKDRDSYRYYFDGTNIDYDLFIDNEKKYALIRIPTFDFSGYQQQTAFENFCANSFELLKHKKNIRSLVIDIRENTGGTLYYPSLLFSYLAPAPFTSLEYASSLITDVPHIKYLSDGFSTDNIDEINKDLEKEFSSRRKGRSYYADSLISKWTPDPDKFKGKIFVITNSSNVSSASFFALMVKYSGTGKIVGDETAGGSYSGNGFSTLEYKLPASSILFAFPYVHLIYKFKSPKNNRRGVIPDYPVPDTYLSFKNNQDKQLDYIIDSLN